MPNPATAAHVAARWRPLSAEEQTVTGALLGDAWEKLKLRIPDIDARLASGTLSSGAVVAVITAAVLRVLRNPDGKFSEQIDDYSYQRDRTIADGRLYIADEEVDELLGQTVRGSRARSMPLAGFADD